VRKLLIAVVVAAVSVAGFAVFATAGTGPGETSWTFKFTPNKAGKPTATHSIIEPAVRDRKGTEDEGDDEFAKTKKTTIQFPKGGTIDTSVPKRCTASGGDLARSRGAVCAKAAIGTGVAKSVIGEGEGRLFLNATIKAYNKKAGIFFLVQPCQPGTGPTSGKECVPLGDAFVLDGKYTRKDGIVRLAVPTPKNLLENNVIITRFELITNNVTKRVKVDGKFVIKAYAITPAKCKGKWTSQANMVYTNRGPLTIKHTQICRRP
jgi:hypothetical protein